METSPVNRLPEADSLPDGFVEISTESPPAPPASSAPESGYKAPLLDLDKPLPSALSQEISPADGRSDGVDNPQGPTVSAEPAAPEPPEKPRDADGRGGTDAALDMKECLDLVLNNLTEGSIPGKLESSEAKRKVVKRARSLLEKELSELTLKYHKVIAERDAAVAVKEKLESLCRELQRQNKLLMNECQRVATEGQNMRMDLSTKFNDAIKDVSNKLEQQKDECLSQLKENEMLRNKLKHLADQYALTEQHFSQQLKQKTLELQLADLKLQQHQERSAQEQTQMQLYVDQVSQLLATEKNLRSQLAADGDKFQQFQDALLKSNEVFETFKEDMEKMGKLTKELKKENQFLKSKSEESDVAIVKLVEERELMKKQLEKVKNQKEKLESLCRSLQAERKQSSLGINNMVLCSTQDKTYSTEEESGSQ